jgi:hypothetical protein
MVVCGNVNEQCELQSLIWYDVLKDMEHFVPMRKNVY